MYMLLIMFSGIDVTAETLFDVLDNGVYLCDLSTIIQKKAEECVQNGTVSQVTEQKKCQTCSF